MTSYDVVKSDPTSSECAGGDERDRLCLQTPAQSSIMEAARAYRFMLLAATTPLLKDLAGIVIDYLIWFRGDTDFAVGNLVDARDLRGKWLLGRVDAVENGKLLVHYIGFGTKWDQWIHCQSDRLAPCHTKTKREGGADSRHAAKLKETLHWTATAKKQEAAAPPPVPWRMDSASSLASLSAIPHLPPASSPGSHTSHLATSSSAFAHRMPSNYGASGPGDHAGNELADSLLEWTDDSLCADGPHAHGAFAHGSSSIPPMPVQPIGPPPGPHPKASHSPLVAATTTPPTNYDQLVRPSPSKLMPSSTPTRAISDESEAEASKSPPTD